MRSWSKIARSARDIVEASFRSQVFIADLCGETGVGVRTLQRCFKEYFDLTLTDYLKTVRLDFAFRALNAAHPVDNSVTRIALKSGFTHLGRFSTAFRNRFGILPSDLLEKRADLCSDPGRTSG